MPLTRRDALRLAAGLADAGTVPAALTPAQAAALLNEPLDPPLPQSDGPAIGRADDAMYDPIAFADGLDGIDCPEMCNLIAPEELAAYYRARRDLLRQLPILQQLPFDHPWHTMDEATLSLGAGAAYEALRRALVGPKRICGTCHGIGSIGSERSPHDPAGGPEVCPECAGNGTIATPAPKLELHAA